MFFPAHAARLPAYGGKTGLERYALVLVLFAWDSLPKPMVITLPFVLLLLDYWPLQRTGELKSHGRDSW